MKEIKSFLRSIDIFGTTFSFRYKDRERYQTIKGGLIIILFIILVLIVGIYYFIPFLNRKNYTIVYYTMNLAATEEVNLFQSESNFAIGVYCERNDNEKLSIHDLIEMKSRYTSYVKNDGIRNKFFKELKTHKCNYEDFYNKYNKQVDFLGLSRYECLEEKEGTIQGIYTDQIFSYYDFGIIAKNEWALKELDRFLFENDCKLEFYYTDIIIDLNNYEEPIKQYLNEAFIQLNPTLHIKRNIFFMNQYFTNDNYLVFVFGDNNLPEVNPLYSRYDEYILYKGLDRINHKSYDYNYYAKVFIRADLKKTIIQRKYQKFMEFYADASSLLIAIYEILFFILSYIDYFYAYHSLAKHLFFFKELNNENNFNILQKKRQVMGIISAIKKSGNNCDLNNLSEEEGINNSNKFFLNNLRKNIQSSDFDENKKDILIYKKSDKLNLNLDKGRGIKPQKKFKTQYIYSNKNNEKESNNFSESNRKSSRLILKKSKKSKLLNVINSQQNLFKYDDTINNNEIESGKVKNSFNIFEIIITQFFKCFMSKKMKIKGSVNENANEIIYKKLDIITYVRNMILFDIINRTILSEDKKDIINFLCRPIISCNKSQKNDFEEFYQHYKENDFVKFENYIRKLVDKPNKANKEQNLVVILNKHLEEFI